MNSAQSLQEMLGRASVIRLMTLFLQKILDYYTYVLLRNIKDSKFIELVVWSDITKEHIKPAPLIWQLAASIYHPHTDGNEAFLLANMW